MPQVEITNMCMILDPATQRVVVQNRQKYWTGSVPFPAAIWRKGRAWSVPRSGKSGKKPG